MKPEGKPKKPIIEDLNTYWKNARLYQKTIILILVWMGVFLGNLPDINQITIFLGRVGLVLGCTYLVIDGRVFVAACLIVLWSLSMIAHYRQKVFICPNKNEKCHRCPYVKGMK